MTKPFRHMGVRRRVSLTIWILNIILCLGIVAFVLR
jgi:hypothetical protein